MATTLGRIAMLGNYPPRLCGIATFTQHLGEAIAAAMPETALDIVAVDDGCGPYDFPAPVAFSIPQDDAGAYGAAGDRIAADGAKALVVQHEYGIFGGTAGAHLLKLVDACPLPLIVTLHTVLERPDPAQRRVLEALAQRASKLVVMAEKGRELLQRVHDIPADRIAVIPHGVPDRPLAESDMMKRRFGYSGRKVLLTFGLLSPGKGIDTMIRALPEIVARHPEALYVVLGATHPNLVAQEGEAYRERLQMLAADLGVARNVAFVDGYVEQELLLDYLTAADIYVTPYRNEAQITSGTLSYAVALGKPVVSTPYWHAAELLADGVGCLVDWDDEPGFAREICALLADPAARDAMRKRSWTAARPMIWANVGKRYRALIEAAVSDDKPAASSRGDRRHGRQRAPMTPRLDAVARLSDETGILQHGIYRIADRHHGYCLDDNARALILMHRVGDWSARAERLATRYAEFLHYSWDDESRSFRNFMTYDRGWLERVGSDDSFGRAIWALGVTAGEARSADMRCWAKEIFDRALPAALERESPRTLAFILLGCIAAGDRDDVVEKVGTGLASLHRRHARDDWHWFEPRLAYDNARLPEAMILAGMAHDRRDWIELGLETLAWLSTRQTDAAGHFQPVGTQGFLSDYQPPQRFDQQPLEAWATIDAAMAAWRLTGAERWRSEAVRAYDWFLGANVHGLPLATPDGGCFDGLTPDGVNRNQGAESILAFQLACCAIAPALEPAKAGQRSRTSETTPPA